MKQDYPAAKMALLCRLFGKTRHAWYDHQWRKADLLLKDELVIQQVRLLREELPRLGTRKLCHLLSPRLAEHGLQIGRDHLFELLAQHQLLIRNRKRNVRTTDANHWMRKYANLTRQLQVNRPEQLWVSDITYIRLIYQFGYLSLITDAYSRKIVGFDFRMDLSAQGCLQALQMALGQRKTPWLALIHHSDRGAQYCCKEYVDLLITHHVAISMTEKGDPYENALAERVNGIIKAEFQLYSSQAGFEQTKQLVTQSIAAYNQLRPHGSCDYLTPLQAHQLTGTLKKRWKSYPKQRPSGPSGTLSPLFETLPGRGRGDGAAAAPPPV